MKLYTEEHLETAFKAGFEAGRDNADLEDALVGWVLLTDQPEPVGDATAENMWAGDVHTRRWVWVGDWEVIDDGT